MRRTSEACSGEPTAGPSRLAAAGSPLHLHQRNRCSGSRGSQEAPVASTPVYRPPSTSVNHRQPRPLKSTAFLPLAPTLPPGLRTGALLTAPPGPPGRAGRGAARGRRPPADGGARDDSGAAHCLPAPPPADNAARLINAATGKLYGRPGGVSGRNSGLNERTDAARPAPPLWG